MSTEAQNVSELIVELKDDINELVHVLRYLVDLENKGILEVDENYQPIVPDNVVHFPTHMRIQ